MSGVPVLLLELMEVVGKPVLPAAARLHRLIPGQRGREYCYTPSHLLTEFIIRLRIALSGQLLSSQYFQSELAS